MSVNYLAIALSAIAAFLFGGVYYRTLSKYWLSASGVSRAQVQGHPVSMYVTTIAAELFIAFMLAGLIVHLGPVNLRAGIVTAVHVWAAFFVTTLAVTNVFQRRPVLLTVIDSGHWLGVLLIMGAIIGAFGS